MKYIQEEVWLALSENILDRDTDFHTLMLKDKIRMKTYEKAIKKAIKPWMIVVDIGTWTWILSLWALQAGAKKVYGIELDKNILQQAIKNIKKAGFEKQYIPHNKISYKMVLAERVDCILSEILWNLWDNENITPILADAKKRFLKPKGIMLPKTTKTYIVPINSTKAHKQVEQKTCKNLNKTYNLVALLKKLKIKNQFNIYYDCILPKHTYLSTPKVINTLYFTEKDKEEYTKTINFSITKKWTFTGFKWYFVANLTKDIILDISGDQIGKTTSDSRKHCYLPIEKTINVIKWDTIKLTFSRKLPKNNKTNFNKIYTREGNITRNKKIIATFKQSMNEEK